MSLARTPPRKDTLVDREEVNIEYPSGRLAALTRKKNEIINLLNLNSIENCKQVEKNYDEFTTRLSAFMEACNTRLKEGAAQGVASSKVDEFILYRDYHEKEAESFRHEVSNWLKDMQLKKRNCDTEVYPDNVSRSSRRTRSSSSRSSSSSLRIKIAEEKAKFEAERAYHNEKILLEEEMKARKIEEEKRKVELKVDEERRLRQLEMKRSEHFVKNLEKELDNLENSRTKIDLAPVTSSVSKTAAWLKDHSEIKDENQERNVEFQDKNFGNSHDYKKLTVDNKLDDNAFVEVLTRQTDLNAMLIRNYERSSLPKNEPDIFDGSDITKYRSFIRSFQLLIENRCDNEQDRLYYLEKYTSGEPHELVKSCQKASASSGYITARKLLEEEYGNEYRTANSYIEKLEKWPCVKPEDGKAFRELSIYISSCANLMEDMQPMNQLNNPSTIMKILFKLPYKYRDKWRNRSYMLMKSKIVTFNDFAEFVREQSSVLNQPIFGQITDENTDRTNKKSLTHKKAFSTLTNKTFKQTSDNEKTYRAHPETKSCLVCKKTNHAMTKCFFFEKQKHEDKVKFIKENKLCFSCLDTGHSSKGCLQRSTCERCKGKHLTIMHNKNHFENTPNKPTVTEEKSHSEGKEYGASAHNSSDSFSTKSAFVSTGAGHKTMCPVVPVKLRMKGSNKVIQTYAGLDGFCSEVFLKKDLMTQLGIKGNDSKITLTTMEGKEKTHSAQVLNNLVIMDLDENVNINIPVVFSKSNWPFTKEDCPNANDIHPYPYLKDIPFRFIDEDLGILLGLSMIDLIKPLKIVDGPPGMPYASLHKLGWAFNGVVESNNTSLKCHFLKTSRYDIERKFEQLCSQEFEDTEKPEPSIDNKRWEQIVSSSINRRRDGHYEIDLPFKNETLQFQSNRNQALARWDSLKRKMKADDKYGKEYKEFMKMMLDRGYAEKVPEEEIKAESGAVWYLTHFGVYHKTKKKIRVVFDCSLKYRGTSLNDRLLQGPDLTSTLLGVLLRYRQENIAILADIQKMFYQVYVTSKHVDFLRFFWCSNGDIDSNPDEYRVTVHIFGATSSPSCANYVLRHTASSHDTTEEARRTVFRNFYVDDMVTSCCSEEHAVELLQEVQKLVKNGGFKLTSIISNSRMILESFPTNDLSESFRELNLDKDHLPCERALGIIWNLERDSITFQLNLKTEPATKRGVLTTIASVYDPFGFAVPVTLIGKKIFQVACLLKLEWDEILPEDLQKQWEQWLHELPLLKNFEIPRCYKTTKETKGIELHIFADGSETAYAAIAYLRFTDASDEIYCSMVMAKSKLVPRNKSTLTTIPRIELNASKLAINILKILRTELDMEISKEYLWTDSMTVLRYLNCEDRCFQTFVANRVAYIRSYSSVEQWHHVPGRLNPSDIASRGAMTTHFLKDESWRRGPNFLWQGKDNWPLQPERLETDGDDLEIKKKGLVISTVVCERSPTQRLLDSSSNWFATKQNVAWFLRLKSGLQTKIWRTGNLTTEELNNSEIAIWRFVQRKEYSDTLVSIGRADLLTKSNKLRKLCPFIDKDNLLRVKGRISETEASYATKHPIILPGSSRLVSLLIEDTHRILGHLGRQTVLTALRQCFWIVGGNSAVRRILRSCLICRKIQGTPATQIMADLPKERVTGDEPLFSNVGIDCFGPFIVFRGRTQEKRYGLIFTCLSSRATHLEILFSLDTNSFINALRRFQCRRGTLKIIRSDNGTNFVGSERELKRCIDEWNTNHIEKWLQQNNIRWKFNPPSASHFGGVWEREIRSVRKVLNSLLSEQPIRLNDECLNTLFCEVESVLNSRPLTEFSDDPNDLTAITPNHLLHQKSEITFPPGVFKNEDIYCRKKWKQVQYLADLFWGRWKKEYLPLLQGRQKWAVEKYSFRSGDLVLVVDQLLPRNHWTIGRVQNTYPDKNGIVRVVDVKTNRLKGVNNTTIVRRPVVKLILLKTIEELNK